MKVRNYKKEYKNLMNKVRRYQNKDILMIKEGDDEKTIKMYSREKKEIQNYYKQYNETKKMYEKGEIEKSQLTQSKRQLSKKLNEYNKFFSNENKKNLEELTKAEKKTIYLKMYGKEGIKNEKDAENTYDYLANYVNKLKEKYELSDEELKIYTGDSIYDELFSGADETPYYEEKQLIISEKISEFRNNLKSKGVDDVDITTIDSFLKTGYNDYLI